MRSRFNNLESFLRRPRGSAEAYLAATVLVVVASLARWGLGFVGQPLLPFTTYYPAILFATYIGGLGVGCYAAILAGLIGWWAFLPPYLAFFVLKPKAGLEILTYMAACGFIIWGANSYRRLVRNHRDVATQLQDEEKLRKVAVDELAHRLKNKIATIQSIVSYQLRGHPELRDAIVDRLIRRQAPNSPRQSARRRRRSVSPRKRVSTACGNEGLTASSGCKWTSLFCRFIRNHSNRALSATRPHLGLALDLLEPSAAANTAPTITAGGAPAGGEQHHYAAGAAAGRNRLCPGKGAACLRPRRQRKAAGLQSIQPIDRNPTGFARAFSPRCNSSEGPRRKRL